MLYVLEWTYPPERRNEANARFKETGGQPPAGVTMVGRWHSVGGGKGVAIAESDDPEAIATWLQGWSDLISFDVYPAMDDATAARVIS